MNDAVAREVAAAHGLDPQAASFLSGSTIEEIEASADALVKLIGAQEPEPVDTLASVLARGPAEKQRRQRALVDALHGGRPAPARDERGRFAAGGFDGGARAPAPTEPEGHDAWLIRVLASRAADVSA